VVDDPSRACNLHIGLEFLQQAGKTAANGQMMFSWIFRLNSGERVVKMIAIGKGVAVEMLWSQGCG
jgi:hypothetical protein